MEPLLVKIYATAGIASAAAICAPAIDKFRNVPAGIFALGGGIVPWLVIAMVFQRSRFTGFPLTPPLCIGPLFVLSFLFYSFVESSATRNTAAAITVVGLL